MWKVTKNFLTAGLLVLCLMLILFATAKFLPPFVLISVLRPGMWLAEKSSPFYPQALHSFVDDSRLMFALTSVVFAFLFWWLCAALLLQVKVSLESKKRLV